MKQILQSLKNGKTEIANVPCPNLNNNQVLIKTNLSLISSGTERMLLSFSKANIFKKIIQQPDRVKLVLQKAKTDGLINTLEAVNNKLDQSIPLGYCNVGKIVKIGNQINNFSLGDRIVSNGHHSEYVVVGKNLCAKIPDNVSDEEASFTVLGAISLQGIRLTNPTLGESIVVIGLGLIGLITVQLLKAQGCRVLGIDFDDEKLSLAKKFGAETFKITNENDPLTYAQNFSNNYGIDAVIITASTTSNSPIKFAAQMCRKRGRIILVGVAGLELNRTDFYEKELTFQVSCSYGPGRYDENYEQKGIDYPIGFVRWTEQRNFNAILEMLQDKKLDFQSLISHKFKLENVSEAYELILTKTQSLGILIEYNPPEYSLELETIKLQTLNKSVEHFSKVRIGFIGSGNYATSVLGPIFKLTNAELISISSRTGLSSYLLGRRIGFREITTNTDNIISNDLINTIVIATRHDLHAKYIISALQNNKNIFVEKPLAITLNDINHIEENYNKIESNLKPRLMVGFNRRFAPQIIKINDLLRNEIGPKSIIITVNAGYIPKDHWTQDILIGGGRLIGEACHFIDLLRFIVNYKIKDWNISFANVENKDTFILTLKFEDGSVGCINYFSNGSKEYPKEQIDIFCNGKVLKLDNFRRLTGYGWKSFKKMNLWKQDKGQKNCIKAFVKSIEFGENSPIPVSEIFEIAKITIQISNSVKNEN